MLKDMLKKVRKAHNFTQGDLAGILGLDRTTYTFYETGKTSPSVATLISLSNIYNCSMGYLAGVENDNPELRRVETEISMNDPDPVAHLSKEEQLVIAYYRLVPQEKKDEVIDMLRVFGKKELD